MGGRRNTPVAFHFPFLSSIPEGDHREDIRKREQTIWDTLGFTCQNQIELAQAKGKFVERLLGYFMLLRENKLLGKKGKESEPQETKRIEVGHLFHFLYLPVNFILPMVHCRPAISLSRKPGHQEQTSLTSYTIHKLKTLL